MVKRNKNISKFEGSYLFFEMNKRKLDLEMKYPDAKIINLSIGNTTEPLKMHVVEGLEKASKQMGTEEGYSGYWEDQSLHILREKIAEKIYKNKVDANDIFVSDGSKPDIGRLQLMFGKDVTIAVQDPTYPVYVDSSVLIGQTGNRNEAGQFENIVYMPCNPENNFFPDLSKTERTDVIFFCSPNNPTGAVATKEQLKQLVDFARKNESIIVFDSAYAEFIDDNLLPKSIFEIEGAKEVALETSSFSKSIGFTGVRLGWTVVPRELEFEDGTSVKDDWNRVMTTIFNGASNIVQYGALSALDDQGLNEMKEYVAQTKQNAKLIKEVLDELGYETTGGINSPYIWARIKGKSSWEAFEEILEKTYIVTTPGAGFGSAGEGFIRFSAFGHREDIEEAVKRLKEHLK